jgi:hypothetical protein
VRLRYGVECVAGRAAAGQAAKPNQDSFCAAALGAGRWVFGVFDGHGPRGEDAANFCRLVLPRALAAGLAAGQPADAALHRAYAHAHAGFCADAVNAALPPGDGVLSGTTVRPRAGARRVTAARPARSASAALACARHSWLGLRVGKARAVPAAPRACSPPFCRH